MKLAFLDRIPMRTKAVLIIFGSVALVGVATGSYFIEKALISADELQKRENLQALAKSNGMHLLTEDEVAIVTTDLPGTESKETVVNEIPLSNGQTYRYTTNKSQSIQVVQGSKDFNNFVKVNDNTKIINVLELETGFDGKVSRAAKMKAKKNKTISVIVAFSGLERFYIKGDNDAKIKEKTKKFNQKKNKASSIIGRNGKVKKDLKIINGISADLNEKAINDLSKSADIASIDLDKSAHIFLDKSIPAINADDVWPMVDQSDNTMTGFGKRIAIIDTGIDYNHFDLGGCIGENCKVIGGYDFVNNDNDPMDDNGHGTHVAATAAGQGTLNGVAPDALLYGYKVCDFAGSCAWSAIIGAIGYATDPNQDGNSADRVDVLNLSLGGAGNPDDDLSQAVDNASAAGVVAAVAAGNEGPDASTIGSPGTARTAITVAASYSTSDAIASFSSRGPVIWNDEDLKKPDITAPGVSICAARWDSAFAGQAPICIDAKHIAISGTSMATPHIAGAVALARQANPTATPQEIKDLLKSNAKDLGYSYDAQGAGQVDLAASISGTGKLTTNPVTWSVKTDPSSQYSITTQSISVTSKDASLSNLNISTTTTNPEVSLTLSKSTLQVANYGTDTFTAELKVNNDQAKGRLYEKISFKQNDAVQGILPIRIDVTPTIGINPSTDVDYGVDNPLLGTWTSETKSYVLTNKRQDKAQSLSITPPSFSSAGIQFEAPPSANVPAAGTTTVDTRLVVNNSAVDFGEYSGWLKFIGAQTDVSVPISFKKHYLLTLNFDPEGTSLGTVWVTDTTKNSWYIAIRNNTYNLYLNEPGSYDALAFFHSNNWVSDILVESYTNGVMKEGVEVNPVASVNFAKSEAVHKFQIQGTDKNGAAAPALEIYWRHISHKNGGPVGINSAIHCSTTSAYSKCDMSTDYFSNISSSYHIDKIAQPSQPAEKVYYFYGASDGINADKVFTNTAADLKKMDIKMDINRPTTDSVTPVVFLHYKKFGREGMSWYAMDINLSEGKQTVYSTMPAGFFVDQASFSWLGPDNESDQWRRTSNCPINDPCNAAFVSTVIDIATGERHVKYYNNGTSDASPASPMEGNTIYNGLGPVFWNGKFLNTAQSVEVTNYFWLSDWYYSSDSGSLMSIPFLRQDFAAQEYNAIPFQLYKNGSLVKSGSFKSATILWTKHSEFDRIMTGPGQYEFRIDSFPYDIDGQTYIAKVSNNFDTSKSDSNPPTFKKLYFYSGDQRSETYFWNLKNILKFELDPIDGSISQAKTSYSTDGDNFVELSLSKTDSEYSAEIPSIADLSKLTIKIEATDSSNNNLTYTFEMPATSGSGEGDRDTEAPETSITNPTDQSTVKGTVAVNVSATDDVGITKVELYAGDNLLETKTTAPHDFNWDTTKVTDDTYNLQAKAYDAADNIGLHVITVKVQNTVPPAAPTNLNLDNVSSSQIDLFWQDNSDNEEGFIIKRGTQNPSTSITEIGRVPANATSFSDTSASGAQIYSYAVSAYNTAGISAEARRSLSSSYIPQNLTAAAATDRINLTWERISQGITWGNYDLQRRIDGQSDWSTISQPHVKITTYADIDAQEDILYWYRIRSNIGQTLSFWSNITSAMIPSSGDTQAPTAPSNLTASAASAIQINLVWNASTDNVGVTGYYIYRGEVKVGSTTARTYSNINLTPSTTYAYRVTAFDAAGNESGKSNTATATTQSGDNPPTVSITNPANGATVSGTVTVTVNASDDRKVFYVNFRTDGLSRYYDFSSPFEYSWNTTNYSNGTHTVMARAYDDLKQYSDSQISVVVNNQTQPDLTISNVVKSVTNSAAQITWKTNIPATSQVEYWLWPSGSKQSTPLDPNLATSHSVTITGLQSKSKYYFTISFSANGVTKRYTSDFTTK